MTTIFRVAIHAFLELEETEAAVRKALGGRKLSKSKIDISLGGIDAAREHYAASKTPNVIILESTSKSDDLMGKIDSIAEVCDKGTQVVIIGAENDISVYRALSRRGVSKYLVPPLDSKELYDTITEICVDPSEPQLGRTIAFMGANGGGGSSSVAHNTAWSMVEFFKEDVALLDLDIPFGTAGLAFNIESQQGINNALAQPDRLDEVLLDRFMPRHNDHLMVLISPASLAVDSETRVVGRGLRDKYRRI